MIKNPFTVEALRKLEEEKMEDLTVAGQRIGHISPSIGHLPAYTACSEHLRSLTIYGLYPSHQFLALCQGLRLNRTLEYLSLRADFGMAACDQRHNLLRSLKDHPRLEYLDARCLHQHGLDFETTPILAFFEVNTLLHRSSWCICNPSSSPSSCVFNYFRTFLCRNQSLYAKMLMQAGIFEETSRFGEIKWID